MAKSPLEQLTTNLTRDNQIILCYRAGKSIDEIGKAFDLSKQRVQQILQENDVKRSDNPRTRSKELYAFIGVNCPKELKTQIVEKCRRNRRSISSYILRLIKDDFKIDMGREDIDDDSTDLHRN